MTSLDIITSFQWHHRYFLSEWWSWYGYCCGRGGNAYCHSRNGFVSHDSYHMTHITWFVSHDSYHMTHWLSWLTRIGRTARRRAWIIARVFWTWWFFRLFWFCRFCRALSRFHCERIIDLVDSFFFVETKLNRTGRKSMTHHLWLINHESFF